MDTEPQVISLPVGGSHDDNFKDISIIAKIIAIYQFYINTLKNCESKLFLIGHKVEINGRQYRFIIYITRSLDESTLLSFNDIEISSHTRIGGFIDVLEHESKIIGVNSLSNNKFRKIDDVFMSDFEFSSFGRDENKQPDLMITVNEAKKILILSQIIDSNTNGDDINRLQKKRLFKSMMENTCLDYSDIEEEWRNKIKRGKLTFATLQYQKILQLEENHMNKFGLTNDEMIYLFQRYRFHPFNEKGNEFINSLTTVNFNTILYNCNIHQLKLNYITNDIRWDNLATITNFQVEKMKTISFESVNLVNESVLRMILNDPLIVSPSCHTISKYSLKQWYRYETFTHDKEKMEVLLIRPMIIRDSHAMIHFVLQFAHGTNQMRILAFMVTRLGAVIDKYNYNYTDIMNHVNNTLDDLNLNLIEVLSDEFKSKKRIYYTNFLPF
jgi:aspartate 1-decarboxylase